MVNCTPGRSCFNCQLDECTCCRPMTKEEQAMLRDSFGIIKITKKLKNAEAGLTSARKQKGNLR